MSMQERKTRVLKLHKWAYQLFQACVIESTEISRELADGCVDVETMAEILTIMKKTEAWLKDSKSQAKELVRRVEQQCVMAWLASWDGESSSAEMSIQTPMCTVTPDIKIQPKIPRRGTPEYEELLSSLMEAPAESIEHDALRPHWPGLCELCTERSSNHERTPSGLDPAETVSAYKTRCVTKVDLLEVPTDG